MCILSSIFGIITYYSLNTPASECTGQSGRADYRRQQHYHNSITIVGKVSRYNHDSLFEGNLKKQELILVPIAF